MQLSYKESILYYKAVQVTIDVLNFAKVIFDVKFVSMAF